MIKEVKKSELRQIVPEEADLGTCNQAIASLEGAFQNKEVMSIVRASGSSTEDTIRDQLKRFKSRKESLERVQRDININ